MDLLAANDVGAGAETGTIAAARKIMLGKGHVLCRDLNGDVVA